jgi:hypothetical protein
LAKLIQGSILALKEAPDQYLAGWVKTPN